MVVIASFLQHLPNTLRENRPCSGNACASSAKKSTRESGGGWKSKRLTVKFRALALLMIGASLAGGCSMQGPKPEPVAESAFKPRDKELLAKAPYQKATLAEPYRRHIVEYHRAEAPGSIVVDSDSRYLYYVLPERKAIRYGIAVGEEALAFSGIAKIGRMAEWPTWTPTSAIKERLGPSIPNFVQGGPQNPLGARALYLYVGNKDTLFRIHGTNQPELIGEAVSSGCIRMTNEDVIDLYNHAKVGSIVVVLAPNQGDSPSNPRFALIQNEKSY
jgi:lipoprotein-anchoring transpeptidase ErfK/SrfK